jgi:putative spermidine/putrescine transport system permease protein
MSRVYHWLPIPALLLLVCVYLVPLGQVLLLSVTDPQPGLGNYAQLVTSPAIGRVLATTARICAVTTLVSLVLGYVVAYALTQSPARLQRVMLACVLLPLWVSVLARAFAWITLLRREGLVNSWLMAAGVISHPLPLMWNEFGVEVGMVHYMLPFAILPLVSHMRSLDPRLMPAARGLGASRMEAFGRVFLPLSLPGVVGAGGLVLIFSMGFYVTPALMGGGRVLMVAEYISLQIQELLRWGTGTMLATVLVLVIGVLLWALSRAVGLRALTGAR